MAAHSTPAIWDIFCRVVDNFGDAGVCWRLARMLQREHGLRVRLWIDDLDALRRLHPALEGDAAQQQVADITVCRWNEAAADFGAAAVIVEAFGCGLPEACVTQMALRPEPPLWIVLEYLTAEPWVDGHHGLSSPHPRLPLPRYFFFPGFGAATGGLLREAELFGRRDAWGGDARQRFWRDMGFPAVAAEVLVISLFAYACAPVAAWLDALSRDRSPVVVAVPDGVLVPAVRSYFGDAATGGRGPWRRGALEVRVLPFLPQARYDELLWSCDLNMVRGEDSFVRAQWAARPLIWQPYHQDDGAHLRKMAAFLGRYGAGLDAVAAAAQNRFWACWSEGSPDTGEAWPALRQALPALARHAGGWAAELAAQGEMAARLVEFAGNKVK